MPSRRGDRSCKVRATNSLPVPLSPLDQHGRVGGGDLADLLIELAHGRRLADQGAIGTERRLQPLAQGAGFARQGNLLQGFFEHLAQALRFQRFGQVIIGAELDRLDRGIDGRLTGDENDRDLLHALAQGSDEFQAGHARHHQVGDDGLGQFAFASGQRGLAVFGLSGAGSPSFRAARLDLGGSRRRHRRRARRDADGPFANSLHG